MIAGVRLLQGWQDADGYYRSIPGGSTGIDFLNCSEGLVLRCTEAFVFEQIRTEVVFKVVAIQLQGKLLVIQFFDDFLVDMQRSALAIDNVQF